MSNKVIGVIDYGMGNHASVTHSLREIGYRVHVTNEISILNDVDVLLLPGVGAFPSAMEALHRLKLVDYIKDQARAHRPILGICLGMQLLASASYEHAYTVGLDLIPGEVVGFENHGWHIGWNTLECKDDDPLFQPSDGQAFYFNHSFYFKGSTEYQVAKSLHPNAFSAAIKRGSVIGLQFHPEKSQVAGKILLKHLIGNFCHD